MNRVALVTGASRGIGRAIAAELAEAGHAVCINYLTHRQEAETLAEKIRNHGGNAIAVQADVADRAAVETMVRTAEAELGPVSLLVNNAGIAGQIQFQDITDAQWNRYLGVNLGGARNTGIQQAQGDWLLLVDEVQTGIGRTGTLFAFQQYGIRPDAVSFAKGIAGGLPMGGFLVNEKCRPVLGPGSHASTFGGNPVCSAAALAVLDILDEAALNRVREKGAYLRERIEAMGKRCLGATRGMGLMIGIDVKGERTNKELAAKLIQSGLLVLTAGPGLRLLPPLVITQEEMDKGLAILKAALS